MARKCTNAAKTNQFQTISGQIKVPGTWDTVALGLQVLCHFPEESVKGAALQLPRNINCDGAHAHQHSQAQPDGAQLQIWRPRC
jgi:hypothetical protein